MANTASADTLVTVTGASGFIATHCIVKLLQEGYRVRGTLRSERRRPEVEAGMASQVDAGDRLTFALVDLTQDKGWDGAMEGATYLLHVASPIPASEPKDENEVIVPAREGAKRALSAAMRAGVKRTVLTSSVGAVYIGLDRSRLKPFDGSDWSDTDAAIGAYPKSKTLAERAAWELIESQAGDQGMELATINPAYVLGPSLIPDASLSAQIVSKLIRREVPGCPDIRFNLVDVRDIAAAHVAAMTHPDAAGKRFIMGGEGVPMIEIAKILERAFADRGYKIPTRRMPKLLMRLVSIFDKTVRMVMDDVGRTTHMNTDPARSILGWTPRSLEEMVVDTGESLITHGLV